jgi:hypothetical protein
VLSFDRTGGAIVEEASELTAMFTLAERNSAQLEVEHGEIVGDRRFDLCSTPVARHLELAAPRSTRMHRKISAEASFEHIALLGLALPHRRNQEPALPKLAYHTPVSPTVRRELGFPERPVALGRGRPRTTRMPMPETAVDEDRPATTPVRDVGRAR